MPWVPAADKLADVYNNLGIARYRRQMLYASRLKGKEAKAKARRDAISEAKRYYKLALDIDPGHINVRLGLVTLRRH